MSELEFKTMNIPGFEKNIEHGNESLTGEIKELKSNKVEIKNVITELQ